MPQYGGNLPFGCVQEQTKAANYTVTEADNGTLFQTSTGAVTFTLPAVARRLWFVFHNNVDANMIVQRAGSDTAVADGNAAAVSATFSTASHKIGATLLVKANAAGTAWEFYNLNDGCTATIA